MTHDDRAETYYLEQRSGLRGLRDDLEEQYPELSEQERMELMVEQNNDYLDDERCNLNIQLSRPILLIADIGRWDGRYPGYAEIKSGNIRDCLYSEMDYSTWYVDRLGDLRCGCRTSRRHEPLSLPCLQGECERSTDRPAERKSCTAAPPPAPM